MPTFTAIALDSLIEPGGGASRTMAKPVTSNTEIEGTSRTIAKPVTSNAEIGRTSRTIVKPVTSKTKASGASRSVVAKPAPSSKTVSEFKPVRNSKLERRNSTSTAMTSSATTQNRYNWTPITPALYATPVPTPLPDSPTSFPPSPYIINHKRRGPRLLKSFSEDDVSLRKKAMDGEKANDNPTDTKVEVAVNDNIVPKLCEVDENGNGFHDEGAGSSEPVDSGIAKENESPGSVSFASEVESVVFYDPRGSASFSSSTDVEDNIDKERSFKLTTPNTEFYDAWEELSSDGASQSSVRDINSELREIRLSLLMEIEKRKQAEESLINMRNQWQRIREHLSLAGLTLPADPSVLADEQSENESAEDLCRQVFVVRSVADSIGRGIAKAEVEADVESQIDAKNFEIARLSDRLHYYEAVNREMSQINQEGVEIARRLRQRRKKRKRWIRGFIAAAITVGAGLAWSYSPSRTGHSASEDSHDSKQS